MSKHPRIIFLRVTSPQEKLFRLTDTIQRHFDLGHKIQIFCETHAICIYMDELLWKFKAESFIPHKIADESCDDFVIITCKNNNLNAASVLINLGNGINEKFLDYQMVYELYDETHPVKEDAARSRNSCYQTEGFITTIQ